MKIFSQYSLTVNISKLNFWLVICIAKNLIWTTLKAIFSIFRFFAFSDSRFSNSCISAKYCQILTNHTSMETSQVTYVTMVPRMGNETLRPLGVATGNALSVIRVWRYICKNTTCWPATAHDVTTGVPQYKCRRENTSSASSSEACVRSMAQSLGDAVSRSPFGEPWLHT